MDHKSINQYNYIIISNHEGDEGEVNEVLMVIESIDGAIKSSNRITLFIPSIECAIKCQSMID